MDIDRQWLTTTQVSEMLGIKPATWRAYVTRGQAPAGMHRRNTAGRYTVMYHIADIAQWAATTRRRSNIQGTTLEPQPVIPT